ncbi:type II CRISPR-associated endonuclease Cas1 [Stenoxybacter acetivorans]|uniref:type II CRISPR-associated endonuclease Cas1 n=1 Tax=Stenoxybacter acetivorans TaxID=422441 RepID=UPI00055FC4C2|nr:type II CRISPR-associated endonuclease Cas1 [Stenoxybacter acetivorans]
MTWRSIIISKGGKLSLRHNQLLIQQDEAEYTVPLEDIAVMVVESREVVITLPLLSAMAAHGVSLLACDEYHLPCGQWLQFGQYHRQLKILKLQINSSEPLKKQLWQAIVCQKIRNQAFVAEAIGESQAAGRLRVMASSVRSGDKDNQEAQAAAVYFRAIFGKGFVRQAENGINARLNYGYSIVRSAVARALAAHGWQPALGLFHRNELNPFNLADDFIEPLRPLVDWLVWQLFTEAAITPELTPLAKQQLTRLLHYQITVSEQKYTVLAGIDRMAASLQPALASKNNKLLNLPQLSALKEQSYE